MTAKELKEKYIRFFEARGHKLLPNVSLVPENDPSTLFVSAGMQPLVPYLLGQPHPLGKRLVSLQRCLRTGDIDEVGNVFHNTFFEMLGNWSLGDYWKKESLNWSLEFLTKVLGLDHKRLHVTVFKGDKTAPKDEESEKIWLSLGIPREKIYFLPKKDNWWEAGETGPGGPDSEIFYDVGKPACGLNCRPGDNCGRFFEMWNNVFMEYNRKSDGSYEKLKQKNVDTGMGVERTSVVLQKVDNIFQTDVFTPIISKIEEISGQSYSKEENQKAMRIIADHLRAAVFALADGVVPSNKDRGYILRRLIRRAIRYGKALSTKGGSAPGGQLNEVFTNKIAEVVTDNCKDVYPEVWRKKEEIFRELTGEEKKFENVMSGVKKIERRLKEGIVTLDIKEESDGRKIIDGGSVFDYYQKLGIPPEAWEERGYGVDYGGFQRELFKHQALSRIGAKEKFAGGLADHSEVVIKYHTATHLLQAALRKVLGDHIHQIGSNITDKRARFDFTHPKPLTSQKIKKIEDLINQKIKENLAVKRGIISFEEAKKLDALTVLDKTYPEKVTIYKIKDPSAGHSTLREEPSGSDSKSSGQVFSCEVCAGPHVTKTGEIGKIKIIREEGVGEGKRRIYFKISNI